MTRLILPLLAMACMGAAPPDPEDVRAPVPAGFFRLASSVRLPGKSPDWDYLAFDPLRSHLFIARRGAGLWVFDTLHQRWAGVSRSTRTVRPRCSTWRGWSGWPA